MKLLLKANPGDGFIFRGVTGKPLVLVNVARGLSEGGLLWRGRHGFRRGLGSTLYGLGVPDKTIQAILRHANVSTTLVFYVKPAAAESHAAMRKVDRVLGTTRSP